MVVVGPIASGKSTLAGSLADRLLARGCTVACADVDDVADMVQAPGGRTGEHWDQAHAAHGALVGGWLATGVDVVIAHGPVYTHQENDWLLATVPPGTTTLRVLLLATFETALRRVSGDPSRGLSRDPAFLRGTYDRFEAVRPAIARCDLTFDTDVEAPESVSSRTFDRLVDLC